MVVCRSATVQCQLTVGECSVVRGDSMNVHTQAAVHVERCSAARAFSGWLFATQHWVFSVQPSFGIFPLCNYFKGLRQRVSYHLNGKLSVLKKRFSTSLEHKAPLIRAHSQTDGRAGLLDFSFLLLCHNHTLHASISEKETREKIKGERGRKHATRSSSLVLTTESCTLWWSARGPKTKHAFKNDHFQHISTMRIE